MSGVTGNKTAQHLEHYNGCTMLRTNTNSTNYQTKLSHKKCNFRYHNLLLLFIIIIIIIYPIPVAEPSKMSVCGGSVAGIVSLNSAGGMDVCLL